MSDTITIAEGTWEDFYDRWLPNLKVSEERGWSSYFNCILPTHPAEDKERKASIQLAAGWYKCFKPSCIEAAAELVGKRSTATILTPTEFLMLIEGRPEESARLEVEEYLREGREVVITSKGKQNGKFSHEDDWAKRYTPIPQNVLGILSSAQGALHEDDDLVIQYTREKGISWETLQRHGIGISDIGFGNMFEPCFLIPYFWGGHVVGIRLRGASGKKGGFRGATYTLYNLDSALESESDTVVVCEGETDTLMMSEMLYNADLAEVPVVGTPGNNFQPEWRRHLNHFRRIIVVPQDDEASSMLVERLRNIFGEQRVTTVKLPWKAGTSDKDLSDFCRHNPERQEQVIRLLGIRRKRLKTSRLLKTSELRGLAEQEIRWIIPGLIDRGSKTLVIGEPKTRKTWIIFELAYCCAYAPEHPFMGVKEWLVEDPMRVMLIEEEGSEQRMAKRWLNMIGDAPDTDNFVMLHKQMVRLDDPDRITELKQDCIGFQPDLIIFDPYVALHSQDENTVVGTMEVIRGIDEIMSVVPDAAIIIIHHTPKGGTSARGSGALWSVVDQQILVTLNVDRTIDWEVKGREMEGLNELTFGFKDFKHFVTTPASDQVTVTDRHGKIIVTTKIEKPQTLDFESTPNWAGLTIANRTGLPSGYNLHYLALKMLKLLLQYPDGLTRSDLSLQLNETVPRVDQAIPMLIDNGWARVDYRKNELDDTPGRAPNVYFSLVERIAVDDVMFLIPEHRLEFRDWV